MPTIIAWIVAAAVAGAATEPAVSHAHFTPGENELILRMMDGRLLALDVDSLELRTVAVSTDGYNSWISPSGRFGVGLHQIRDATMDAQLNQRWDLVPNVVDAVKAYMEHERERRPLHFSFLGNHLHLAVHFGRRLFEPSVLRSVSFESVQELAELFDLAEVVVRELDLNVRIWTKGPAR